jgi:hypothetical protein
MHINQWLSRYIFRFFITIIWGLHIFQLFADKGLLLPGIVLGQHGSSNICTGDKMYCIMRISMDLLIVSPFQ